MTPRYLVKVFSGIFLLLIIKLIFCTFFWGGWKIRNEDFDTFWDNLLALSQHETHLETIY